MTIFILNLLHFFLFFECPFVAETGNAAEGYFVILKRVQASFVKPFFKSHDPTVIHIVYINSQQPVITSVREVVLELIEVFQCLEIEMTSLKRFDNISEFIYYK